MLHAFTSTNMAYRSQPGFHTYSFSAFLFFSAKHKARQVSQLTTFIPPLFVFVLKSRLIVQLSARSRVCGIATLEPLLETTGVWSGVLNKSFSLCVERITLFRKKWLQVLFWLWSPMFLWLDYCQACGQFSPRLCKRRGIFSSLNVTFDDFWFHPVKQCVKKVKDADLICCNAIWEWPRNSKNVFRNVINLSPG